MKIIFSNEIVNRAAAYALRQAIFVEERGIDANVEFDKKDTDQRIYGVLFLEPNFPIATLRLEPQKNRVIRFGRICTRKEYRGQGFGQKLLEAAEQWALENGMISGEIHGELTAQVFYEKCGYQVTDGPYYEDGAPVVKMAKKLK
ncbi:GNAT family N-acetyltransferase [Fructilactobacillus vespulae]|uniref:GNAT family N-acetyltransferase n=1 Tax=Fructilactobacillus vespulae TaxID=1249630 RepID=UPI0039B4D5EE